MDPDSDLCVDAAVSNLGVVPVELDVDALAQPRDAHQHEQLQVQEELVLGQHEGVDTSRLLGL